MGNGLIIDSERLYLLFDIYKEIESNSDLNNLINKLSFFSLSDKFIFFFCLESLHTQDKSFYSIISLFEMKDKFLSLKIIFPLFEELKKKKYENQIEKIEKSFTNKEVQNKQLEILFVSYINDNRESITDLEKFEKGKKLINDINNYVSGNLKHIELLSSLYLSIFYFVFIDKLKESNDNKLLFLYNFFKQIDKIIDNKFINQKEELNDLIDNLIQLKPINHTKDIYQINLFILNLFKNKNEISLKEKLDKNFFEIFGNLFNNNINEKLLWVIYEEEQNICKSDKKYKRTLLEGKKTEKEKFTFNIFENTNTLKLNNKKNGMNITVFRSIFTDNKIIIIKIDLEYYKKPKIILEQIKEEINNEIKLIVKSIPQINLNPYIQIKNKIINFTYSYDLFLNELINQKIIEQTEIKNEKIKNVESLKIYENNLNDIKCQKDNNKVNKNEINESKDKNNNKELVEEINKLKKELNEEKNKNKIFEKKIIDLKNELNKEINKYKELKEKTENDKIMKKNLDKKSKESFLESIMEKDNEIKELKIKISRYPFELKEGEKLMSIIVMSADQEIHLSLLCKNTDKFHKIEDQIYEKYPKYAENENFFTFNGNKINKYKTMDDNNIKNNAVVILNIID